MGLVEKWGCCIAAAVAFFIFRNYAPHTLSTGRCDLLREILTTYATITAIFSGLLTTAASNFMTHSSNIVMELLQKHKLLFPIINYCTRAILANAVVTAFSLMLSLLLKIYHWSGFVFYFSCAWVALAVYSFFSFVRISLIFYYSTKKSFELEQR